MGHYKNVRQCAWLVPKVRFFMGGWDQSYSTHGSHSRMVCARMTRNENPTINFVNSKNRTITIPLRLGVVHNSTLVLVKGMVLGLIATDCFLTLLVSLDFL